MARILAASALLCFLAVDKPCDLSQVEDGFYCPTCDEVLAPEAVVDVEFCKECKHAAERDGLEPDKAEPVKVCVKTCFECPSCSRRFGRAGECLDCKKYLRRVSSRSRIVWACENCRSWVKEGEPCPDLECVEKKARVRRTCSESGTFPHTAGR